LKLVIEAQFHLTEVGYIGPGTIYRILFYGTLSSDPLQD
jgi:hypothetical protein